VPKLRGYQKIVTSSKIKFSKKRSFIYWARIAHLILIPLIAAAVFSLFNQLRKGKMLENQTGLDSIQDLSWRQFEELVGEVFRRQGYLVLENPSEGVDGGIDLRLRKNGQMTFVQCKHWKSKSVGVKIVRELYGVMTGKKANIGIIVTFGNFTQEAKAFAKGKPIHLIGGNQLVNLISEVQTNGIASAYPESKISCPKCGSEMVLRTAKKGILKPSGILKLSYDKNLPVDKLNELRRKQLLDLAYDSHFRIGLCVFITLPSGPGGPWGGVAGIQKLIGVRALRKLEQEESSRIFKLAENFINSKGALIAFQKNAWNCLRSEKDAEYSIGAAREARLKGNLKGRDDMPLLCVPPTRSTGPSRMALKQMLKNNFWLTSQ
jgi:restriction system protein